MNTVITIDASKLIYPENEILKTPEKENEDDN